jgi:hypothetical protein
LIEASSATDMVCHPPGCKQKHFAHFGSTAFLNRLNLPDDPLMVILDGRATHTKHTALLEKTQAEQPSQSNTTK